MPVFSERPGSKRAAPEDVVLRDEEAAVQPEPETRGMRIPVVIEEGVYLTSSPFRRHGPSFREASHPCFGLIMENLARAGLAPRNRAGYAPESGHSLEGALMSELVNVLPVLGGLIALGALALGGLVKPAPVPVPVKKPRR
jgi:hypothetical protein